MKGIMGVETLQIHLTNACVLQCAGCTHLCGHHKKPYMMTLKEFKKIIDSLQGYPKMIGFIGGEPMLNPDFSEMARYAASKFPREQLGLWSVFPEGDKYKNQREVICECFGNILLNDHTLDNIMHAPVLMASGEYFSDIKDVYAVAENCWVQNSWSPGITPKGAFFCEVAAELDQLFDGPGGWDVSEHQWWKRTPKDFTDQIERSCSKCGCAIPFKRRVSQDDKCDISEGLFNILKGKSRKVDNGQVYVHKTSELREYIDPKLLENNGYPDQVYKMEQYRKGIAARYNINLVINSRGYWEPVLPNPVAAMADPREIFQTA